MLSFADSAGNLYNRLGRLGRLVASMDAYQANQLQNLTNIPNGATAQFQAEPDLEGIIGTGYVAALNAAGQMGQLAQQVALATLNRMIFRDSPLPNQTLTQQNILGSLGVLIYQMELAGATVLAQTVSAVPTTFQSNNAIGSGVAVASIRRPIDARFQENSFAENLYLICTADSYTGGATVGNETFSLQGEAAETNYYAFDWPMGSGANITLQAINGSVDNTQGNMLTNSGWSIWTAGAPNNWVVVSGGNLIAQETGITYDGNNCMAVTGDGATQLALTQTFNNLSTGTGGLLNSLTIYPINLWLRRGGSGVTGQLALDLVDGTGAVITDNVGNPNTVLINASSLNTVFTPFNGVFRTPNSLPTGAAVQVRSTPGNPLTGGTVYLARMGMGSAIQAYSGGPWAVLFSGSVPFVAQDFTTISVSNSRGLAGTLDTWQTLLARFFSSYMLPFELLLPSSSTPNVSDTLITR